MDDRGTTSKPTPRKRPSVKDRQRAGSSGGLSPRRRPDRHAEQQSGAPARLGRTAEARRAQGARRAPGAAQMPTGADAVLADRRMLVLVGVAAVILIILIVFALRSCAAAGAGAESRDAAGAGQAAEPASYSISFASTGDLIFWREVADYIDANGGASAMANIADDLAAADVTIANLESPLSDDESQPIPEKDVYIIGRPSGIEGIVDSDVTFASLANNHIMDYGRPALEDTLEALDGAGVLHAGAGLTEEAAGEYAETTVDGASIAFFSWTDIIPNNFLAFGDEPGVVSARMNMDDACKRVREAKETHDIVIVAMHWGVEYEDRITEYLQSEPAHQLVDAGADVILGNHPHVIEGIEFYKGSLIAYAHGNCVFWQRYDHTHESYILNFDMTQDGVENVVATPLYLDDVYGIPSKATGEQAQVTLGRLEEISSGMNTTFEIRDGRAYVTPTDPGA